VGEELLLLVDDGDPSIQVGRVISKFFVSDFQREAIGDFTICQVLMQNFLPILAEID
jgi:hypothetical protein